MFKAFGFVENDFDWILFKQLIAAPILEELMFRSLIFGVFRDSGVFEQRPRLCVALLPLYFATAHAHKLWQKRTLPWSQFQQEIFITIF